MTAWLSPVLTKQEVRQKYPELDANDAPAEIVDPAITEAENRLRPLFAQVWEDDSNLASELTVRGLVIKWAAAEIYESNWGMATFIDTAKSVSGNIGAAEVQQAAAAVEKAIKEGQPRAVVDALLAALAAPVSALIDHLEQKLPALAAPSAVTVDPARLDEVCARLDLLLANDDSKAARVLTDHGALLRAALGQGYQPIEDGIRNFEFESALTALRAARTARDGG